MAVLRSHDAYLQVTMRRSRQTWMWSAVIALTMNLALFTMMPHLLHRSSSAPVYEQLPDQISVVRIKRHDSEVRQKTVKPPEPPPEKKVQPQAEAPAVRPVKTSLSLPFDLNPRLPVNPANLTLPAMKTLAVSMPDLQSIVGLGQLDAPLTSLARIPPVYPLRAKRDGIEGWVKVEFVVNEQGNVDSVTIVKAQPPDIFNQSVIRCVSKWRFKPGTVEGTPVKFQVETTVRFKLE